MSPDEERGGSDRPDYKVYRARPGFFSRFRRGDLDAFKEKPSGDAPKGERPPPGRRPAAEPKPPAAEGGFNWKRGAKWAGIAAIAWILLSFLAFAISSQIQSGKLANAAGDALSGNPFLLFSPQTILVLGSDVRPSGLSAPGEETPEKCVEAASRGETPPSGCSPYRSDTILLVRAGGKTFRKLSIPRDTLADIPGHGSDKINSAYAFGGAKLTIQTVEQFLGIDINHVAVLDFNGFRDFISSIGGVKVNLPEKVCSEISGGEANGGFSLKLPKGESTLDSDQALTLARTRENSCGNQQFSGTDIERAQFQQLVLNGIKDRLTDPTRLPYNFLKGPIIGWEAPKAFVSDMGMFTMPQLVMSAAIAGTSGADVLTPSDLNTGFVPQSECERALRKFLGHAPDTSPPCSPAG
jgi:LCP family protein required for cell wall assembly